MWMAALFDIDDNVELTGPYTARDDAEWIVREALKEERRSGGGVVIRGGIWQIEEIC